MGHFVLENYLLNVVLKVLNHILLPTNLSLHLTRCLRETFLAHAQVVHDQHQVLVYSVKVFLLRSHLVCLLIKLRNVKLLRADVSFEFFDFVVENKFELLKLLNFLLQLSDLMVFLFNGGYSGLVLLLTRCYVLLNLLLLDHSILELVFLLLQVLGLVAALHVLGLKLPHKLCQLCLILHAILDTLRQHMLVLIRHRVNLVPGLFFSVTASRHDAVRLSFLYFAKMSNLLSRVLQLFCLFDCQLLDHHVLILLELGVGLLELFGSLFLLLEKGLELFLIHGLLAVVLSLHVLQGAQVVLLHLLTLGNLVTQHLVLETLFFIELRVELLLLVVQFFGQYVDFAFLLRH